MNMSTAEERVLFQKHYKQLIDGIATQQQWEDMWQIIEEIAKASPEGPYLCLPVFQWLAGARTKGFQLTPAVRKNVLYLKEAFNSDIPGQFQPGELRLLRKKHVYHRSKPEKKLGRTPLINLTVATREHTKRDYHWLGADGKRRRNRGKFPKTIWSWEPGYCFCGFGFIVRRTNKSLIERLEVAVDSGKLFKGKVSVPHFGYDDQYLTKLVDPDLKYRSGWTPDKKRGRYIAGCYDEVLEKEEEILSQCLTRLGF